MDRLRRGLRGERLIDGGERALRSLLFAPGNHPRKLEKVGEFGADAIVLDLEDAVADAEKDLARDLVRSALPTYADSTIVAVRVNSADTGRTEADARAVVCPDLDCIMVPKVERPDVLPEIDRLLAELERVQGMSEGQVRLLALIETAKGLVACEEIAQTAPPRLLTLVFGLGDFSVDLGVDLTEDATELLYARSRVVVAARAAGLRAALDGPYLDLHNMDGLLADSRRSRQLGFEGRVVVYPPQVDHVHRAYSDLPPKEVERAQRVVEAFEAAEESGSASIQVDGRFVDYPIYERAKRKLRLYETLTQ